MITQELLNLYLNNYDRFGSFRNQFPDQLLHGPYLCSPGELYKKQPTPLLCIGQETNAWASLDDIKQQMEVYKEFNLGEKYKSTPFWNLIRKLEKIFNANTYSSAALNLNRFDVEGKSPESKQIEALSKLDDLLAAEISVLKPKVCVFFTSHKYDGRLEKIYPGLEKVQIPDWPKDSLCIIKHQDLPEYTFRTYHPSFLRRTKLEPRFLDYMSLINSTL